MHCLRHQEMGLTSLDWVVDLLVLGQMLSLVNPLCLRAVSSLFNNLERRIWVRDNDLWLPKCNSPSLHLLTKSFKRSRSPNLFKRRQTDLLLQYLRIEISSSDRSNNSQISVPIQTLSCINLQLLAGLKTATPRSLPIIDSDLVHSCSKTFWWFQEIQISLALSFGAQIAMFHRDRESVRKVKKRENRACYHE